MVLWMKSKGCKIFCFRNCDKPRLIEALKTKRIRDIACGSSHSAAITSSGELYSWGLGEYGRLGHGDNTTQLRPKLVCSLCLIKEFPCNDDLIYEVPERDGYLRAVIYCILSIVIFCFHESLTGSSIAVCVYQRLKCFWGTVLSKWLVGVGMHKL